jgi:hypothetical protein
MPVPAAKPCAHCRIIIAPAEDREIHKGEAWHPHCWAALRDLEIRALLRDAARSLPSHSFTGR